MDNGLPAGANFSPDTSDKEHRPKANKKRRRTNMQKKAAFPCHLKATVPCGRIYGLTGEGAPMKRDTRVKLNALVVLDQPPKKGRRWLRARHSETPPRRACRNKRRCPRGWPHGFHHVFRRSIAREVPANARADALQVMRNPLHCRIFSAAWTLVAFLWKCCAVSRACNCATALVPRLVSFVLPKLLKEKQLSVSKNCRRHLGFSFWLLFRYSNVGRSALFSSGLTYFVLTFSPVVRFLF